MEIKKTLKTFCILGSVDVSELAYSIFEKTGVRLILDEKGQNINGAITCYPVAYLEKKYTLIDINFYGENLEIIEDELAHDTEHNIKKTSNTNINKVVKFFNNNFEVPDENISEKIIKFLS